MIAPLSGVSWASSRRAQTIRTPGFVLSSAAILRADGPSGLIETRQNDANEARSETLRLDFAAGDHPSDRPLGDAPHRAAASWRGTQSGAMMLALPGCWTLMV